MTSPPVQYTHVTLYKRRRILRISHSRRSNLVFSNVSIVRDQREIAKRCTHTCVWIKTIFLNFFALKPVVTLLESPFPQCCLCSLLSTYRSNLLFLHFLRDTETYFHLPLHNSEEFQLDSLNFEGIVYFYGLRIGHALFLVKSNYPPIILLYVPYAILWQFEISSIHYLISFILSLSVNPFYSSHFSRNSFSFSFSFPKYFPNYLNFF